MHNKITDDDVRSRVDWLRSIGVHQETIHDHKLDQPIPDDEFAPMVKAILARRKRIAA